MRQDQSGVGQCETALAAVLADPETDLKAAVSALAALPPVVAGDPAGEMIAAWSDGAITATAVHPSITSAKVRSISASNALRTKPIVPSSS